jgi:malate dehydrogenase (oxaloacetate-decarboxylating)
VDVIVETAYLLTPGLGGVNLEDISAPRCFEIERKLQAKCDIPVFHDDQHGTAVIALAGFLNALKIVDKKLSDVKIVLNGAGAAGTAICKFLMFAGAKNVILCDRSGAICKGRGVGMNDAKEELAATTNPAQERGSLTDVLKGADVFMGVSAPGTVTGDMVKTMRKGAILFAMANPTPEIFPDEAKAAGAAVVGTGRSDFPNQVNNCLGFPGIFRGALDVRATCVNQEMKLAASHALADLVSASELSADYILPQALDSRVVPAVAKAVAQAARKTGAARS